MNPNNILLAGDTHGNLRFIRYLFERAQQHEADLIFQLGDFGYWEHDPDGVAYIDAIESIAVETGIPFYFLDGNHDNHPLLWTKYTEEDDEGFIIVRPHIRYSPRGHHWTWNGKRFCSLGGAYSIDIDWRRVEYQDVRSVIVNAWPGLSKEEYDEKCRPYEQWWDTEMITDEQAQLAQAGGPIDILLSHDTGTDVDIPFEFHKQRRQFFKNEPHTEANRRQLQSVIDACRPSAVYSGHYHINFGQRIHGTEYRVLDCDDKPSDAWWMVEV